MEIAIGIVVVVVLAFIFGQMSLDKPLSKWSDDELVRRLPKYERLFSTQVQSGAWVKSAETQSKIEEIRAEIVSRQQACQAEQVGSLRQESLFGGSDSSVITEGAISKADAGDVDLQVLVGAAYLTGSNGLPQQPGKAGAYLLKAADQGHPLASFVIAGMYSDGIGFPRDLDIARSWAVKAKSLGAADVDQLLAAIDSKRA